MPDRSLTPHELHQKAISVLDQLERLAVDWTRGRIPDAREIDVVTARVAELRARAEETAEIVPELGPAALVHLAGARTTVADAMRLVGELAGEHPDDAQLAPFGRALRPDAGA